MKEDYFTEDFILEMRGQYFRQRKWEKVKPFQKTAVLAIDLQRYFLIKITPLNPTVSALKNRLTNDVDLETGLPMKHRKFVDDLRRLGYDVIISVGDTRENLLGSNCGQYILRFLKEMPELREAYTFARGFEFKV